MPNGWINKNVRQQLYVRDECTCCYCGKKCSTGVRDSRGLSISEKKSMATLDHIVPQKELAESSANDKEFFSKRRDPKNIVVVCMGCNSSKNHTPLYIWCARTNRDYIKIEAEIIRRVSISVE